MAEPIDERVLARWPEIVAHVRSNATTITGKQARAFAAQLLDIPYEDFEKYKTTLSDRAGKEAADELRRREACTALQRVCKKAGIACPPPTAYAAAFKGKAAEVEADLRARLAEHGLTETSAPKVLKRVREKMELLRDVKDLTNTEGAIADGPRKARRVASYAEPKYVAQENDDSEDEEEEEHEDPPAEVEEEQEEVENE